MFTGIAIGAFFGYLIHANQKGIIKLGKGLGKAMVKYGSLGLAIYGLVQLLF